MESILSGLAEKPADIKADGDFLGGFTPLESNIYDLTVKLAYITVSAGGAKCLNVTFVTGDKRELRQQFWLTSSTAKGCLTYYVNQKTMEKQFLPGFTMGQHLSLLTTGQELHQLTLEKRHIKLYSYEAKAEVPTEVNMCVAMLGKQVSAGIVQNLVDKNIASGKVNADGTKEYIPSGETRIENEVVKLFRTRDKMTVAEITAKAESAEFAGKWLDKNKGIVIDKTKKTNAGAQNVHGVAGTVSNAAMATTDAAIGSLFA